MQNLGHYLFMNKDTIMAELYINYNVINIVQINKNIPIFNDMEQWIYNRLSPFGRDNISKILKGMGVNSREDYIKVTKAVSLTDTFWIKEKDSNLN